jgi:small-conductance mechanosensitive channel
MTFSGLTGWLEPLIAAFVAVVAALIAHRIGRVIILRLVRISVLLDSVARKCDRPAQWVLPLAAVEMVWHASPDELPWIGGTRHYTGLLLIAAVTWLAVAAVRGLSRGILAMNPADTSDNLRARSVQTQTRVLARIAMGAIMVIGLSFMLMTFPGARQLGTSLLASAGVAGLVAGIAAKSVFSNLIAGLQIALSQPMRIDDVLIVQGEWGRVEEITGTYVVLALWDQRRLIIPLQWFIENPFQNWTRHSAELLGSVFLWVDYTLPIEPLRQEARRLCEGSREWDGRVCVVQVVDTTERGMQLRVLVSSASSGLNWDLRCTLREGLIAFIAREHPQALPRLRAELASGEGPHADERAMQPQREHERRDDAHDRGDGRA